MHSYRQKGVGMIEVLVSLLIIVVAILGFVVLQMRAIQASHDAVIKTQAMHFMQSISESIRANKDAKNQYLISINTFGLGSSKPTATVNCTTTKCSAEQFAIFESYDISQQAQAMGIQLGMVVCPGIATSTPNDLKRLCLFAGWDDTKLKGTTEALNYSECMNATGNYVSSSHCLMMETY